MSRAPSLSRHGAEEWYLQRLSAVVVLLCLPAALWFCIEIYHGTSVTELRAVLNQPWVQLVHAVFALAVSLHAYIGIKIIIEDYIHHAVLRSLLVAGVQIVSLAWLLLWLITIGL